MKLYNSFIKYLTDISGDDWNTDPGFSSIIDIYYNIIFSVNINAPLISSYEPSYQINLLTYALQEIHRSKMIIDSPRLKNDIYFPYCYFYPINFLRRVVQLLISYDSRYSIGEYFLQNQDEIEYAESIIEKKKKFKYFYDKMVVLQGTDIYYKYKFIVPDIDTIDEIYNEFVNIL
jgi:hypothetical protein